MILDLDVGNTRIKWKCSDSQSKSTRYGSGAHSDWHAVFDAEKIARVRMCCVAREELARQIESFCSGNLGIQVERVRSLPQLGAVRNGYREPERLGADRWMAVIAGYQHCRTACCIADCGSAITVDFVDAQGNHLGGMIAPGMKLMRRALLSGTDGVVFDEGLLPASSDPIFGASTQEAVNAGVLHMEVGLIESAYHRFTRQCPTPPKLLLTGGDAGAVAALLNCASELLPHLVLDGISLALP